MEALQHLLAIEQGYAINNVIPDDKHDPLEKIKELMALLKKFE